MYLLPKLHKCLDNGPGSPIISNPCYTYVRRKLLNFQSIIYNHLLDLVCLMVRALMNFCRNLVTAEIYVGLFGSNPKAPTKSIHYLAKNVVYIYMRQVRHGYTKPQNTQFFYFLHAVLFELLKPKASYSQIQYMIYYDISIIYVYLSPI